MMFGLAYHLVWLSKEKMNIFISDWSNERWLKFYSIKLKSALWKCENVLDW